MALAFSVERLSVSDGSDIDLPPTGIVVFVGPNNAGKSAALREIHSQLANAPRQDTPPKVITGIATRREGTEGDLEAWLDSHAVRREPTASEPAVIYRRHGSRHAFSTLKASWESAAPAVGSLAEFFATFLGGEGRLGLVGSQSMWDTMGDDPQNPLQMLFADPQLEAELSDAAREAFGIRVFVNRHGGANIHLQFGDIEPAPSTPPPREYMDRLRHLPHIHEQGDGIKSFMGIMLTVVAARYPLVLIDEPEAFLHPPQSRLLGRALSRLVPQGTQVFVATHSTSVLLGLLEGPSENVTVIRLTREGSVNPAAVLTHDNVRGMWNDPLLRYSNILDGLFHRGVVICEADADATFYSVALDASREAKGAPASDLQFTHCGGKDRMHVAIAALRAVGVPVRAIADIDVLRDEPTLRRIVESLGGSWADIADLRRMVDADVRGRERNPTTKYAREAVEGLLSPLGDDVPLTRDIERRARDIFRIESGWDEAKRAGFSSLTGETFTRAVELVKRLQALGLFVVPVGELERFCPAAAGTHGPAWVAKALEQGAHRDEAAARLVEAVDASLN